MRSAFLALLFLVFLCCHATAQTPVNAREVAGVVVVEKVGELNHDEEKMLRELKGYMIPLPDTIWIASVRRGNGGFVAGNITISPERERRPSQSQGKQPYLFGRKEAKPPESFVIPGNAHTLAHELAHFYQYAVFNGRPEIAGPLWWKMDGGARGPHAIRMETEAELMAAALQDVVLGIGPQALGYPEETWAGSTEALVGDYKAAIADFYRVNQPFSKE